MIQTGIQTLSVMAIERNWKVNKPPRHSMQDMCSRICSFPASIPSYFIGNFSRKGEIVFDMWSGRGSVPFEALRMGRVGIGNDKSPEAYVLTCSKVNPVSLTSLQEFILRSRRKIASAPLPQELSELDKKASVFYSKKTFEQILRLKKALLEDTSSEAIFTKAIILGLLHGNGSNCFSLRCSHSYSMSPAYVKKYAKKHHLRRPTRDVLACILNKAALLYRDPLPKMSGMALNNDSTHVELASNSVDLILTSPPYFDTQTYAWGNWLRLWFLGHDYKKIRRTLAESGSEARYADFMKKSIGELYRVLKPNKRCFIVVGDVKACRGEKIINTAAFLLPLCLDAGFELERVVVDSIPRGRKVMTYIPASKGIKTERILYLVKPK